MSKRTIDFGALLADEKPPARNFQQEMINLTKGAKSSTTSSAQPVKRGRGRPRKNPLPPPPEPESESESSSSSEESSVEKHVLSTGGDDDQKKKINKIGIITELRKKLNAVGTGMNPGIHHTMEQLDAEIDVLNSEINSRRGDAAVKQITLMLMPLIEGLVKASVPPDRFDVTGLQEEVNDNWEILEDACQHIAILHRDWFEISPYAEWCKGVYSCAASRNLKNQQKRLMGQQRAQEGHISTDE